MIGSCCNWELGGGGGEGSSPTWTLYWLVTHFFLKGRGAGGGTMWPWRRERKSRNVFYSVKVNKVLEGGDCAFPTLF